MTLASLNELNKEASAKLLLTCCGSTKWVSRMMEEFPLISEIELLNNAAIVWYDTCKKEDWLEAFLHHPVIGDVKDLEKKFASTSNLAANEQAAVSKASQQVLEELAKANAVYAEKFGFIFIICATGKTADEMLRLLLDRIKNTKEEELNIAMGEQHKITVLRLKKILQLANWTEMKVSQLTTHVLDTTVGKPGENMTIRLKQPGNDGWQTIAQGVTNADGRIADLLASARILNPGNYKMVFETANYFSNNNIKGFYPEVEIQFTVSDDTHYHIPLLINPFGYTTYRGS